jgi:hypothetical protein
LKNDVDVPSKGNKQKDMEEKNINFLLTSLTKIAGSESGSISQPRIPTKISWIRNTISECWGLAAQVSKADLLDFPELPSVPVDTPVGGNTPHDDDDDIGTHVMQ